MKRLEITNKSKFNRLSVISELPAVRQPSGQLKRYFHFKCDCGNEISATLDNVRSQKIKSCGCLNTDNITKHNLSKNPLASIWYGMHDRCHNHPDYTGRNITVCSEWSGKDGLSNFIKWAELDKKYISGLEIDRENNNLGYYPNNCRFVSRSINQRNKRNALTVEDPTTGNQISLLTLWENIGNPDLNWITVRHRYKYLKWTVLEAINKPVKNKETACDY